MSILAAVLATSLHAGQIDAQGQLYIDQLTAVVTALRERWPDAPLHAVEAAWLHLTIAASVATPGSLLAAGVGPLALQLIVSLTRPCGTSYPDWITRLAASNDIWIVRIALVAGACGTALQGADRERLGAKDLSEKVLLEDAEERLWHASMNLDALKAGQTW